MKEFIEKLIGRLEEEKEGAKKRNAFDSELSYKRVIKIVNQLAEEYRQDLNKDSQGWIPCSERLPEGKESQKVLVTDEDGIMAVCYFLEVTNIFKVCWDGEEFQGVIAWQPLPEPYQSKGE